MTHAATCKALEVLKKLGLQAEAISASRPVTGTLYKIVVQAPWLPIPGSTAEITQPSHLHGYGAEIADINQVELYQRCR